MAYFRTGLKSKQLSVAISVPILPTQLQDHDQPIHRVPLKETTHLRHFLENIVNNFHNTVFHSLFRNTYYFPN